MKAIVIALIILVVFGAGLAVQNVSLPSEEDTIRLFFRLINDGRTDEALKMMFAKDEQAWKPYLEAFETVAVVNLKKTESGSFQADLDVKMKPESENQPIPYFGYADGLNVKLINLVKDQNVWKIKDIATGP